MPLWSIKIKGDGSTERIHIVANCASPEEAIDITGKYLRSLSIEKVIRVPDMTIQEAAKMSRNLGVSLIRLYPPKPTQPKSKIVWKDAE